MYIHEAAMSEVNVTTLRQHLPEYLARVERGERIRVTSRGRVIAEIAPPAPEADAAETARARLKASLVRYDRPFEPVLPVEEWEMNR
jgi:prevent-host-death family protein